MKKNLTKVLIVLGIGAVLLGAVAWYNQSKLQAGSKAIRIVLMIDAESGKTTLMDKTVRTDALTLGELLDQMQTKKQLTLSLNGSKSDPFGRYIVGINEYITTDSTNGPWWLYNSITNPDCISAQYCAGIDQAPIYDKDLFTFTFTSSFD
ncbi:MAG: hypothetical protein E4G74_03485 [Erysipelotrichales bacterium]|nr:MAG: hypothetical protein E4G74_03485 [Erysipelotrichales bacterium]